jgi:hypothetical protein
MNDNSQFRPSYVDPLSNHPLRDNKIQMIKEVREKTQCGLKESKEAVELAMKYYFARESVVGDACHQLSPNVFPPMRDLAPNYRRMWDKAVAELEYTTYKVGKDVLNNILNEELQNIKAAEEIERAKNFFQSYLREKITEISGRTEVYVYDSNSTARLISLKLHRAEVIEILRNATTDWIQWLDSQDNNPF